MLGREEREGGKKGKMRKVERGRSVKKTDRDKERRREGERKQGREKGNKGRRKEKGKRREERKISDSHCQLPIRKHKEADSMLEIIPTDLAIHGHSASLLR